MSTTLPLPSSPHWAPRTTVTLVLLFLIVPSAFVAMVLREHGEYSRPFGASDHRREVFVVLTAPVVVSRPTAGDHFTGERWAYSDDSRANRRLWIDGRRGRDVNTRVLGRRTTEQSTARANRRRRRVRSLLRRRGHGVGRYTERRSLSCAAVT